MFDLAVLRRTGNGEELIDVGQLAETLLSTPALTLFSKAALWLTC